jgi:SAM-dependent methyltransferase
MRFRALVGAFAATPLHPQWLLGRRSPPEGIESASGIVLDIGAGDRWVRPYLGEDVEYLALDYPRTGRDLYAASPDVFADAGALPFADGTFDGVICLEVLEHVREPALVIREIARVLKSGGRAWLSTPFLYPLHDVPFDFQRYTEFGLRRDFESARLSTVSLRKSLHAIRCAGLLICLAIAGPLMPPGPRRVLLPLAVPMVLLVNCTAWLLSLLWPDWNHLAVGYEVELCKL